jgi:hypothetical protein
LEKKNTSDAIKRRINSLSYRLYPFDENEPENADFKMDIYDEFGRGNYDHTLRIAGEGTELTELLMLLNMTGKSVVCLVHTTCHKSTDKEYNDTLEYMQSLIKKGVNNQ